MCPSRASGKPSARCLGQHGSEQRVGAALVQRLVAVAALGRLHARRAPGRALARGDRVAGRAEPGPRRGEPALGEARRRRGGRRRPRPWAARCPGAARSRPRRCPSGRRSPPAAACPIAACSAACAAPGMSAGSIPAPASSGLAASSTTPPWSAGCARAGRAGARRGPRRRAAGAGRTSPASARRRRRSTAPPRPHPARCSHRADVERADRPGVGGPAGVTGRHQGVRRRPGRAR